jgi:hypothetical protein
MSLSVVILTTDQPHQSALCYKLAAHCEIRAIVLSKNIPKKKASFLYRSRLLLNRIAGRIVGFPCVNAWRQLQQSYRELYPNLPDVPIVRVGNINDSLTIEAIKQHAPELIVVSGTNLIGKRILEFGPAGTRIINLHTGHPISRVVRIVPIGVSRRGPFTSLEVL